MRNICLRSASSQLFPFFFLLVSSSSSSQGHCHVYERIYPNVNGTVMVKTPTNVYLNPNATAYVVQGTGGAYYDDTWVDPQPAWSALRISHEYGLGLVEANLTTLTYSFILEKDDSIKDQFFIVKE